MEKLMSVIRHIVGGLGAALVGAGLADPGDEVGLSNAVEGTMGSIMFLIAVGAGIYNKVKDRI